ncbi:hypothetical protein Q8A67_001637 [Cirrhinus molitorella]|uniref:Uncharacterized protein n=1 Tax=Cirrhinus molitorella TaxID=172907 RepID=A0AA88TW14_9TELE|nr:hypothetical protein Q8A67_001637 [Cirrhinus molitorella]
MHLALVTGDRFCQILLISNEPVESCWERQKAKSLKIQIVRFAVKSDGYVNESAVLEAIEKKMNQILGDQQMEIESSVTWRVQPDGQIFQRQDK